MYLILLLRDVSEELGAPEVQKEAFLRQQQALQASSLRGEILSARQV